MRILVTFPKAEDAMTDVGEVVCEPPKGTCTATSQCRSTTGMVMSAAPWVSAAPAQAKKKTPESARDAAFKNINELNRSKFDKASV